MEASCRHPKNERLEQQHLSQFQQQLLHPVVPVQLEHLTPSDRAQVMLQQLLPHLILLQAPLAQGNSLSRFALRNFVIRYYSSLIATHLPHLHLDFPLTLLRHLEVVILLLHHQLHLLPVEIVYWIFKYNGDDMIIYIRNLSSSGFATYGVE